MVYYIVENKDGLNRIIGKASNLYLALNIREQHINDYMLNKSGISYDKYIYNYFDASYNSHKWNCYPKLFIGRNTSKSLHALSVLSNDYVHKYGVYKVNNIKHVLTVDIVNDNRRNKIKLNDNHDDFYNIDCPDFTDVFKQIKMRRKE